MLKFAKTKNSHIFVAKETLPWNGLWTHEIKLLFGDVKFGGLAIKVVELELG